MSVPVVDSKQPRSSSSQVSQATHVKDGAAQDIERASIHSEGTEFSPAGVNRISAFCEFAEQKHAVLSPVSSTPHCSLRHRR